jgi:hypothetical protein
MCPFATLNANGALAVFAPARVLVPQVPNRMSRAETVAPNLAPAATIAVGVVGAVAKTQDRALSAR